jgi:hypothetical protein
VIATSMWFALAMAPAQCSGPPLSGQEASRAAANAAALREAEAKATEDPDSGTAQLEKVLADALADADVVALDRDARDARLYAMLALARGRLAEERNADAATILDRALALSGGAELPVKLFGPSLVALHGQRKQAITGTSSATLVAECSGRCVVVVDATPVGCAATGAPLTVALPPGAWDVRLVDTQNATRRVAEQVTLVAGTPITVALAPSPLDDTHRRPPSQVDSGRKLPRWAGIVGVSVGVLAMIGGGIMIALDGTCPDGTDPKGDNACNEVLDTDVGGYVMLGAGAATTVGFSVPLGIGEAKDRRAKKRREQPTATFAPGGLRVQF